MKNRNTWLYLILGLTFIVLIAITLFSTRSETLTQLNIIVQLIYTFVTTLMVVFTYRVLKETQEQKNQSVRPYLFASNFDFWHSNKGNNTYDLDFQVYNQGMGLALKIVITVMRLNDNKIIKKAEFTRLDVIDNPTYGVLCSIRDEINHIRNNGSNGMRYSPYIPDGLEIEIPLEDGIEANLNLRVEISYNDIYNKCYKNTFDVVLNQEDNDSYECIEKFEEL